MKIAHSNSNFELHESYFGEKSVRAKIVKGRRGGACIRSFNKRWKCLNRWRKNFFTNWGGK